MFHVKCFKGLQNNICPFTRLVLGSEINPLYIFSINDIRPAESICIRFNNNYSEFKRALGNYPDLIADNRYYSGRPNYGGSRKRRKTRKLKKQKKRKSLRK
jgi:hypothetical protein